MKKITKLLIPILATASAAMPITTTLASCSSNKRQMNEIAKKIKTEAIDIFLNSLVKVERQTFHGLPVFNEIKKLMKEKAGIEAPTYVDNWSKYPAVQTAIEEAGYEKNVDYGNMWYDLAPTTGHESDPTIILQCHTDMEYSGSEKTTPTVIYDEPTQTIYTDKTCPLGADDGMAVATFIALAKYRNDFPHGKVRLIFSPDGGAEVKDDNHVFASGSDYLQMYDESVGKTPLFDTPYIINFDGTKQSNIYRSSAGIHRCNWDQTGTEIYEEFTPTEDDKYYIYGIEVSGFLGGHSGNQMNLGRGSALKLLTEMLVIGDEHFHIIDLKCPEQKNYNICNHATVEFIAPKLSSTSVTFAKRLETFEKWYKSYYPIETGIKVTATKEQALKTTDKIGCFKNKGSWGMVQVMNSIIFGPTNWFDKEHTQVLTSTNIGPLTMTVDTDTKTATVSGHVTTRSASKEDLEIFSYQAHELFKKNVWGGTGDPETLGGHLTHNESPAWERLENNHLSNMLVTAYKYFKYNPVEFNTHSWVEAAVFPNMLARKSLQPYLATIGCTIVGSGTFNETVYLQTLDTPIKGIVYVLENAGGLPHN